MTEQGTGTMSWVLSLTPGPGAGTCRHTPTVQVVTPSKAGVESAPEDVWSSGSNFGSNILRVYRVLKRCREEQDNTTQVAPCVPGLSASCSKQGSQRAVSLGCGKEWHGSTTLTYHGFTPSPGTQHVIPSVSWDTSVPWRQIQLEEYT